MAATCTSLRAENEVTSEILREVDLAREWCCEPGARAFVRDYILRRKRSRTRDVLEDNIFEAKAKTRGVRGHGQKQGQCL